MRKLSVYLVVVVGSLLGYFASLSVEKTIMENVGVKVSESSEGNSAFKRLGFQHSHFKCNHNHGNIISQEDRDKYNSLLRKALAEKDSLELKLEDLPDCPLKDELAHFNDEEMIKNTLHRLIDLNPPVEDLEEIHVDKNGGIFYACKGLALEGGADLHEERLDNLDSSDVNGSVPISSPPVRHSKPDSVNTIYLDFNGENISGTGWNSGSEEWVCQPYNRDSDPTTFNEDEQLNILTAWAKVAEDYAPFDVNVTTERPAVMNSRVAHVMITPGKDANGVSLPHNGYGGIAYVNVFGRWQNYLISFCQPYGGKNVAEVISHEVGHNMGLSHDGRNGSTYYRGHGSGETSWAPIMGASYYKQVTHWSNGDYNGSTNTQDDLSILESKLGYRTDDHGDLITNASTLKNDLGSVSDSGLIQQTGERDIFKFSANAGSASFTVNSYQGLLKSNGGNMDIALQLQNSSGVILASYSNVSDTDGQVQFQLPSRGDYYLVISPDNVPGWDNNSPNGYSLYGTLGQYFISGNFSPYTNNPPVLEQVAQASPEILPVGSSSALSVIAFDTDGDALTYQWSKLSGDGNVSFEDPFSSSTTALFSQADTYVLLVTISDGVHSIDSQVQVTVTEANLIGDSGSFEVEQQTKNEWKSVSLSKSYKKPVVIFSPLTFKGGQPAHIRVKNVQSNSFEWQIEEWGYLDGYHLAEKVDYIVMEAGTYTLQDGRVLVADNVVASDSFNSFPIEGLTQSPVVVSQLISAEDEKPATVRMRNISQSSFEVLVQSEEANDMVHGDEIVSYIAVEQGIYAGEHGLQESATTGTSVNHNWFDMSFINSYQTPPSIFASFQTSNGMDTGDLRIKNLSDSGVKVKFQEEKSKDSETWHKKEKVGYILFDLN